MRTFTTSRRAHYKNKIFEIFVFLSMTRDRNCKSLIGNSMNWRYKTRMIEKDDVLDNSVNV